MKLTKFRVAVIIFTLVASSCAYFLGYGGFDVARAVTESRCSAGAFIAHSESPSAVIADAHTGGSAPANTSQAGPAPLAPVTLAPANLIANGGLEERNAAGPFGWYHQVVGINDGKFAVVPGHNSSAAVRAEISKFTTGSAVWLGQPIAVTPGAYYQFQDSYRSSVPTWAEVTLRDQSGKAQFVALEQYPASSEWATYTQRFFVPANVTQITVAHPLYGPGWLETDNHRLQAATQPGFAQGMVSLTFDDGWRSIHTSALPLMKRYEIVSTQYLTSGFLGQTKTYMKPGQVYDFVQAGHEIASHTFDHPDLTRLSDPDLPKQLEGSKTGLTKCYGSVTSFAPPFGASNQHTTQAVSSHYQTSRSVLNGFNAPDTFNPYLLKVQNVRADTSPAQMQAWLETAKANNVWLILVYHQVAGESGEFARRPEDFEQDLQAIKASGLNVQTVQNAYLALKP